MPGTRTRPAKKQHAQAQRSRARRPRNSAGVSRTSSTRTARGSESRRTSEPAHKGSHTVPAGAVSKMTTDHEFIRRWAEERGAHPACVRGTGKAGRDTGMIRLDFPGFSGPGKLEPIDWDEFFDKFEESDLALLYQEETAGGEKSNFNKLVSRERMQAPQPKSRARKPARSGGGTRSRKAR